MRDKFCLSHEVSNFEFHIKAKQVSLAIETGEIGSVLWMIADELRLLMYFRSQEDSIERIALIDCLLGLLPSRFSHDPDDENEEWQVYRNGLPRNGELTTYEVDWLHNEVNDAIRAAALVRESRFSDGNEVFKRFSYIDWNAGCLLTDIVLARARDPFVGFMENSPSL